MVCLHLYACLFWKGLKRERKELCASGGRVGFPSESANNKHLARQVRIARIMPLSSVCGSRAQKKAFGCWEIDEHLRHKRERD